MVFEIFVEALKSFAPSLKRIVTIKKNDFKSACRRSGVRGEECGESFAPPLKEHPPATNGGISNLASIFDVILSIFRLPKLQKRPNYLHMKETENYKMIIKSNVPNLKKNVSARALFTFAQTSKFQNI